MANIFYSTLWTFFFISATF